MGLSVDALRAALPELYGKYFPRPDATTGMFDLDAIVRWRQLRHPVLFGLQDHMPQARDARIIWAERQARKAKERQP